MNTAKGITLNNRYTLTERIAAGGMGEVWAATDTVLRRTVAVKLLHPALSQEFGFVERFRAEARHTAGLHHPNITATFDYGEDGGTAYLVMELVDGQPLSQVIFERAPLSAQETSSILIQAAIALEAAHQGGVVHRDVKPANIMITADGTAKLMDFGISRMVDAAPLTQTGNIIGTAQYLSPEQAMGQDATASSDIYALGVVGHEMLTGKRPFDAGTMVATALAHINQAPPPLPDSVPAEIRKVISAAMAKDPADRPASAAAMAEALGMPDAAFAAGVPAVLGSPQTIAIPAVPAFGMPAVAVPAVAMAAQGMPTQAMPTQAMPTPKTGARDRSLRARGAWLLGAASVLGVLAFVLLSGLTTGTGSQTPAAGSTPTATSSSPNPSNRTPKITTIPKKQATPPSRAPAVQPPAVTAPLPRRDNRGKGSRKKEKDEDRGDRG